MTERALPALAEAAQALRQLHDRQHRGREDEERDQRERRVLEEGDDDQRDQRRRVAHDRRDGVGERAAHQRHVVADPRQDVARRGAVEEREREALDVLVQLVAHVADDALADQVHQVALREARDAAEEEDDDDGDRQPLQRRDLVGGEDVVEDALDEERQYPGRGAEEQHCDRGAREPRPDVRPEVAQEPQVRRTRAARRGLGTGGRHASISAAIAAARSAAPPPPRAGRISARAWRVAAACAGSSRKRATSATMRSAVASS